MTETDFNKIRFSYHKKAQDEWSKIAGEPIEFKGTDYREPMYAFGSELACLRLFKAFSNCTATCRIRVEFSDNLEKWFFCKELIS